MPGDHRNLVRALARPAGPWSGVSHLCLCCCAWTPVIMAKSCESTCRAPCWKTWCRTIMSTAPHQTAVQGQDAVQSHIRPPRACRRAAGVQGTCRGCSTPAPVTDVQHPLTGPLLFRAPVDMFHPNPSMDEESTLSPDARAGKPCLKLQLENRHLPHTATAGAVPVTPWLLACSTGEGGGRQMCCCAMLSCWGRLSGICRGQESPV